jgi:D-alanine-D-alanine ligase
MRINLALVTGGYSGELAISLKSAGVVKQHLDLDQFNTYTIIIDRMKWIYINSGGVEIPVDRNDFSITEQGKKIRFDCVFLVIHGTPGEDGKLQGYFDLLGLPYTTCNVATSSVTFNKYFTNRIAHSLGVNTARSFFLTRFDQVDVDAILQVIGLPCFVKPNNGGSSVGITKVMIKDELLPAIDKAFGEDPEVVVEQYVRGFEITCGMINFKGKNMIFPITEIVSKKDFFDYEAKYTQGMADEITPARITQKMEMECRNTSAFLYHELNCKGIVRFDYIVSGDDLYFLEVNTIPGLTEQSLIPKMVKAMGLSLEELYSMVVQDAVYQKEVRERRG